MENASIIWPEYNLTADSKNNSELRTYEQERPLRECNNLGAIFKPNIVVPFVK